MKIRQRFSGRYWIVALLAAMLTVSVLGWVVARDFQESAEAANDLYDRFGEGLDLIDNMLFETEEVRRVLLYALHTSDANRQLDYVDLSRAAEGRVKRLLESRSPILSTARTRAARESVAAAWADYLTTRDEVIGLILEGSLREGVALDEAVGNARFMRVHNAMATLKASFKADAAAQVEAARTRSARATTRLALIVLSAVFLVALGMHLVNRRASLEAGLRIKSDFLATMSHELRTPLTGVIGIADLLQTASIPPAQHELVRMLRSNATTLLALVNNVLDYSRIEAGLMALTPRQFFVYKVVEDALDAVAESATRKGLALGYVIDPHVPAVVADEGRVRQVVLNLLSNAVKFTDQGEIAIRVNAATEAHGIAAVRIQVRDTGIGIREDLQQQLFRKFSQIEPANAMRPQGTGLGLAISDRLSRLLGGSITVDSRCGEGSTFTFVFRGQIAPRDTKVDQTLLRGARALVVLPAGIIREQVESLLRQWEMRAVSADAVGESDYDVIVVGSSEPAMARPATRRPAIRIEQPVRRQALHDTLCAALGKSVLASKAGELARPAFAAPAMAVLLVEDNEPNRRVIRLMLNELGLEPDEAAGGYEAIEATARRHYDIILMDLQMPDLDGLEATRRIRAQEQSHRATIIALTATVFESDDARCRAAGMDGYLQKPLNLDTLSGALGAAARSNS